MGASVRAVFTQRLKSEALLQHVPDALTAAANSLYISEQGLFYRRKRIHLDM